MYIYSQAVKMTVTVW